MAKKKITLENLAVNQLGLTKIVDGLAKTVGDLAREMRGGFAGVDVKIKESEKRIIKEIDIKMDANIDELALMTKRGFDSVDERFDKVDERFDKLEKTNTREHEEINTRLEKVDEKLAEHDSHFTALEMAIKFGFDESKKRDEKLEAKIDESITLLDGYVNKQESFKQEFTVMKEEMKQVKGVVKNKLGVEIKTV